MNEEQNIAPLIEAIRTALDSQPFVYEVVLVDDGSTDSTAKKILAYDDPRIFLVQFRRNFGQSSAMTAGIDQARGQYIVTLDGDLQNDPADIPMMLEMAEAGEWDLVAGVRANRKDGALLRKLPSRLANRMIRRSTGVKIKDYGCTLKVFESDIAKNLGMYGELHRFIPVLASLQGARITQVDVKHHARQFGKSKYGIGRTFRVMSDLLLMLFFLRYRQRPIHLLGKWGIMMLLLGFGIDTYLLIRKFGLGEDLWGRPLLFLGILFPLVGLQLIMTGLLMEVQMRTYYESQGKRPFSVRHVFVGGRKA